MTQNTTKKINYIWKKFCNWDPNYSDYIRNTAWSVSSTVLVTLALKLETWKETELILLFAGFTCLFISALRFTKIGNFIKKQQSKFSDLKLITRSKNNFRSCSIQRCNYYSIVCRWPSPRNNVLFVAN